MPNKNTTYIAESISAGRVVVFQIRFKQSVLAGWLTSTTGKVRDGIRINPDGDIGVVVGKFAPIRRIAAVGCIEIRREDQILRMVAGGVADEEISAHLSLRPSTVRTYVARLKTKLGVTNRAQLGAIAGALGLAVNRRDPGA